jgi:hypothetical protein
VGWKSAFKFYRDQPLTHNSEGECVAAGALCQRRFDTVQRTCSTALFRARAG